MNFVRVRKAPADADESVVVTFEPKGARVEISHGEHVSEAFVPIDDLATWSIEAKDMVRRALGRRGYLQLRHGWRNNRFSIEMP